jgi:hypothetical protein
MPPFSDLMAFRAHCHHAARTVGAKILGIEDPSDAAKICNYSLARFEFSGSQKVVLLNTVYPVIGFANCPSEGQVSLEYVDCQTLAQAFRTLGDYIILPSEDLNRPLVREMCSELTPSELKRVRYFRPARVGDVIFNYWD